MQVYLNAILKKKIPSMAFKLNYHADINSFGKEHMNGGDHQVGPSEPLEDSRNP